MMFSHWATPVVSKRWAIVATLHHWVNRKTGYRVFSGQLHRTWQKAVGH